MNVLPTEEELMVKNAAREFLDAECPPSLARAIEQDERGYSVELWEQMASLGWFGISLPEAYGGGGLPVTYLGLILEECGRAIAPVPFHSTATAALAVANHGSDEQKQSILPRVARGDLIMTWAVQEQDPRLRADAVQCRGEVDGDSLVINGIKHFVDNFSAAELVVMAVRTAAPSSEGSTSDNAGITLAIVPSNSAGITETRLTTLAKDSQSKIELNDVRIPLSNVIGEVNQGWPATSEMLDTGTALLCAPRSSARRARTPRWPSSTPRTASPLAARSPVSSPSSTSAPTWWSRWTAPNFSPTKPCGSWTPACPTASRYPRPRHSPTTSARPPFDPRSRSMAASAS